MGSQLIFLKCFTPKWLLLSSWRQFLIHLFWTVYNLLFNFLFRFGYQALHRSCFRYGVKYSISILKNNNNIKENIFKNMMSPLGDSLQITNKSLTQKLDKQVHCGKQVNQISVTNNSVISKQLYQKQKQVQSSTRLPIWLLSAITTGSSRWFSLILKHVSTSLLCWMWRLMLVLWLLCWGSNFIHLH